MPIKKLVFKEFKNLSASFEPHPQINLLVHPNGWGKTNFLEGIDYLSSLKSFRGISDRNLLNWREGVEFAQISAELDQDEYLVLKVVLSVNEDLLSKKLFLNNSTTSSSKFKYHINTILYSPHSADIVSSDPETRRTQFDRIISQIYENYDQSLRQYKFVVKSKNKLLQSIRAGESKLGELDYWNQRLIDLGETIIKTRLDFLHEVQPLFVNVASRILNSTFKAAAIEYESKCVDDELVNLEQKVEGGKTKEINAGVSLYGPHRDDFVFLLNSNTLRDFGSRGQQRLAGIALVLALYQLMQQKINKAPILLLDDIFSELDEIHRKNIEDILIELVSTQVFITASEINYFTGAFLNKAKLL